MKLSIAVTCIISLSIISACNLRRGNQPNRAASTETTRSAPGGGGGGARSEQEAMPPGESAQTANDSPPTGTFYDSLSGLTKTVSLVEASEMQESQVAVIERKIIRDAEINLEVASPAEGQRKLASIAEAHGGFVVTTESRLQENYANDSQPSEIVTIQLRVPASRFDAALAEIRAVGTRVRAEKQTGKDVTEEFIDLDARLRTQRALETQFLEIMKRADKVSDALEVHTQLASVRTEIERVEGRRRFLENQAALSTINATLQPPASLVNVNTRGFLYDLKSAFGDGINTAAEIILGIISFGIALLPVLLFILLPLALIWRYLIRPRLRRRKTSPPAPPVAETAT